MIYLELFQIVVLELRYGFRIFNECLGHAAAMSLH